MKICNMEGKAINPVLDFDESYVVASNLLTEAFKGLDKFPSGSKFSIVVTFQNILVILESVGSNRKETAFCSSYYHLINTMELVTALDKLLQQLHIREAWCQGEYVTYNWHNFALEE